MPDEQPQQPSAPPDPFGEMHANWVGIGVMYRSARRTAGLNMAEAAFLIAAFIISNAKASEGDDGP